jgi:type II secretory ATPase GspE/PulE/Tfp pilus assembly ATPase PilB-like protein
MDCQKTGYHQRTGIFEVVSLDAAFQEQINHQVRLSQLRAFLRKHGIRSLYDAAMDKVKNRETTLQEIRRVIDDVQEKAALEI